MIAASSSSSISCPTSAASTASAPRSPPPIRVIARLRGGAARVDLQAEQQLVLLGDVAGTADQLQVGDKLIRRVLEGRVRAFGLEQVVAERVGVGRERALDPADTPHRRAVARQRGEHGAVLLKARLAILRAQQRERAAADADGRGERAARGGP